MTSRVPTISPLELVAALAGETTPIRALLAARHADLRGALANGVVAGSASPRRVLEPRVSDALIAAFERELAPRAPLEIALAPSHVHDGRFAHNAWLQELPHPITKQTWGNAALVGPATAAHLGVGEGDGLRVTTAAGTLVLPALIVAGHVEHAITIELGYGRRTPELAIANRLGANGHVLRDQRACVLAGSAVAAGTSSRIARTQTTFGREGRTVAVPPEQAAAHRGPQPSLLGEVLHTGVQWAMSIDTALCTGCSACVVACQAENNIPVVGPAEIARGRGLHWLRIDSYVEAGEYVHEPMACQHCEHAPCEYVCPVGATTHSPDGLNEQTYNRCVGTRFCSNNCPYKVRRFNYFAHDVHAQHYNPDVTVRARGVMEKCTYCVQRIRRAEQTARVEDRAIRPGEVTTACQDACPTGAIQFGALDEPGPLARMRQDPRRYEALHELGTRPRTQYLARTRKEGA
jgi:molybdopterin-containing oxidoreductase family iron-sulfur binding subunit